MFTFQEIITKLTEFWSKQGCILHQGHDVEVGAGTFNPATFLRCLGPEPYKTAYVEPSRRPQDGRFGENPNRVQLFHQFQVIIKPSPLNIQELYLYSLEAIGIQLKEHDIRFVHDDWEGPTLGAWGLGWEVWFDGMEITQFTYFQAMAGLPTHPVSVEITYGLERLAMAVQNCNSIFAMKWNEEFSYGDICHQNEVEWSNYNFYKASTEMWLRHFEDFALESKRLLQEKLPIPAYDFVIKASHAFNMLEARGILSVSERAAYITRIRELAKNIAALYLKSRQELGFPLLSKNPPKHREEASKQKEILASFDPEEKGDFLLEIGSEELPATFVPIGCEQLKSRMSLLLEKHNLSYKSLSVCGTPRRLALIIQDLLHGTKELEIEKKGPLLSLAFDEKGTLTPQGRGFFQSIGREDITSLSTFEKKKGNSINIVSIKEKKYLIALVKEKGISTEQLLQKELPLLITELKFPKKMRWSDVEFSYARPLRWIVALFEKEVLPFEISGVFSSNVSYGHRQLDPRSFTIKYPGEYLSLLKKHKVIVDIPKRKESILSQLKEIEEKTSSVALKKERVLEEVLFLTEWPQLFTASFDPTFLATPEEVLISEMVEHQRYFPLAEKGGRLKNAFVVTADNNPNELIQKGNERVLSARLSDGTFLYQQDLKVSLEDFGEKLKTIIFLKGLGTLAEKQGRLKHLVVVLAQVLSLGNEKKLVRAASLAKADLASELVREFPDLQGTIGKDYALHQKEDLEVALAIEEHYLPKAEGGDLPTTPTGIILGLADKIDTLIGSFSIGLKPTSSSDPYALRRHTIGMLRVLIENQLHLSLPSIFQEACTLFPEMQNKSFVIEELLSYTTNRIKVLLESYELKKEEIEASLQKYSDNPFDTYLKAKALHEFRCHPSFDHLFEVYKRAKGQIEKENPGHFHPDLLYEKGEKELYEKMREIEGRIKEATRKKEYPAAFLLLSELQKPLAFLFDTVKILAENPKVKGNRIALLHQVFSLFTPLVDFAKIQRQ